MMSKRNDAQAMRSHYRRSMAKRLLVVVGVLVLAFGALAILRSDNAEPDPVASPRPTYNMQAWASQQTRETERMTQPTPTIVDVAARATVETFTGRPLRTDADLAREFALKDELCAVLDDAATFRWWARRAHLERGNSAQYSIAAGWGAMSAAHGLNQTEAVLYSTYCTRRTMFNDSQEVAWATAVGVVKDNLAWIETGDYKTISTTYATPWQLRE